MQRACTEHDRTRILAYISKEPEVNLYFSGDIEAYGVSEPVTMAAFGGLGDRWGAIALALRDNYVVYSQDGMFDPDEVARWISSAGRRPRHINARLDIARRLHPLFGEYVLEECRLARCVAVKPGAAGSPGKGCTLRKLGERDYDALFDALETIAGSTHVRRGSRERDEAIERKVAAAQVGCSTFGIFCGDTLLSTASVSSASKLGAMISGVATRPEMRRRGLATAVVSATCEECFRQGMRFVTLYYTDPTAARIYGRIGFEDVAGFGMMSPGPF